MTEQAIVKSNGKQLANFGDRDEIRELSERIKMMLPGGQRYTDPEARTLAQLAIAHDLDPFNGEVWLIKDEKSGKVFGALIGIKGHRKHAKKDARYWGTGTNGGFERITDPSVMAEYGADPGDIVFEYRIMDEKTLDAYTSNLERLTKVGIPVEQAQAMFGPPPVTIGIGMWKKGENTKMKPAQCAMFRAEKDALKRRFDVKFRVEISGQSLQLSTNVDVNEDLSADEVEAEYTELLEDEPRDQDEILEELGFAPQEQSAESINPDPVSDKAWQEWLDLVEKADEAMHDIPVVHRERVTTEELREIYQDLRKRIK